MMENILLKKVGSKPESDEAYYVLTQTHTALPNASIFNTLGDARYLKLDGSNANSNIDIGAYDFTTTGTGTFGSLVVDTITIDDNRIEASGDLYIGQSGYGPIFIISAAADDAILSTGSGFDIRIDSAEDLLLRAAATIQLAPSGASEHIRITFDGSDLILRSFDDGLIIKSDSGTVSFDDDNITTTGAITATEIHVGDDEKVTFGNTLASPDISFYYDSTNDEFVYDPTYAIGRNFVFDRSSIIVRTDPTWDGWARSLLTIDDGTSDLFAIGGAGSDGETLDNFFFGKAWNDRLYTLRYGDQALPFTSSYGSGGNFGLGMGGISNAGYTLRMSCAGFSTAYPTNFVIASSLSGSVHMLVEMSAQGSYNAGHSGSLAFFTTSGTTRTEVMRLTRDGNVGIGVADPHSKLEVAGAISSATATITESTANMDVSGINILFVNPGAATSITGFTNGVAGQVLFISAVANGQDITMVHNSGTQKVFLHTGGSETLSHEYGGWTLTCDGSNWYDTEHSKHV